MAQTGFTPISLYYTTTAAAAPTAGNLVAGELAINTNDGVLYYKDSSGVVQSIASKAGNSGSFTNLAYTGTLTGGTGIVNLGSGQFYKDASGNVGIGVAPSAWVSGDTIFQIKANTGSGSIWGRNNSIRIAANTYFDGTNFKYIASDFATQVNTNISSVGGLNVSAAPSGTAGANATFTQVFDIQKSKSLALEGATSVAGTGITFPATQSASSDANTLDDYEEGTWTPNQGAGLTVIGTFSSSGTYTKIGRQVTIIFQISGSTTIAAVGGGATICTNIPFTVAGNIPVGTVGDNQTATVGGVFYINIGSTTCFTNTALTAKSQYIFTATYFTS